MAAFVGSCHDFPALVLQAMTRLYPYAYVPSQSPEKPILSRPRTSRFRGVLVWGCPARARAWRKTILHYSRKPIVLSADPSASASAASQSTPTNCRLQLKLGCSRTTVDAADRTSSIFLALTSAAASSM
jgi:hypothetical protein